MFQLTKPENINDNKKEAEKEKVSNFGATLYGKTAADFFTGEKDAKYLIKTNQTLMGDQQLFESESKRAHRSRVNWVNWILCPFLILCSGL